MPVGPTRGRSGSLRGHVGFPKVGSHFRFRIGIASEAENGLPHGSSAPKKRSQKLKNEKNTNQVDNKDTGDASAAEPFGDPAARRCDELWPGDRKVYESHRSDEHTRFADGTNCFVCAFSGHARAAKPTSFQVGNRSPRTKIVSISSTPPRSRSFSPNKTRLIGFRIAVPSTISNSASISWPRRSR